uniref:BTB domain-containing protein n=1 Tax=Panagrolaimus davidi TaxID=227884 RepID=A0A914P3A3_9BILA
MVRTKQSARISLNMPHSSRGVPQRASSLTPRMMKKIILQKAMEISLTSKTVIKIDENREFTVAPIKYASFYYCQIKDIKGDFEISNIKNVVADGKDKKNRNQIKYNIENQMFKCLEASNNVITLMFTIVYDEVKKSVNVLLNRLRKIASGKTTDELKPPSAVNSKCHRCVLSKHSKILSTIFKSRESPIEIIVEEFKGEIIQAAIDFLYDKTDSIKGIEADVFNFAKRYGIHDIMNACCLHFKESVNSTNVCELIQIAYSNNFEELKQKCLKILVEKKKEIIIWQIIELCFAANLF